MLLFALFFSAIVNFSKNQCVGNVVSNPTFDSDLTDWTSTGGGSKDIYTEGVSDKVLEIVNPDASTLGVWQDIPIQGCQNKFVVFRYEVKPIVFTGGTVGMDVYLKYEDNSTDWYMTNLLVTATDTLDTWFEKYRLYSPDLRICEMRVLLLNYYQISTARYNNLCITLHDKVTYEFNNGHTILSITNLAKIISLTYNGVNKLLAEHTLCEIYISGSKHYAETMQSLGSDRYKILFRDTLISITMEIISDDGVFYFNVVEYTNPMSESIDLLQFFIISVNGYKEDRGWEKTSKGSDLFIQAFPMNNLTYTTNGKYYHMRIKPIYNLYGKAALATVRKENLASYIESFIIKHNLPHMTVGGRWLREKTLRESYLFSSISHNNYEKLVDTAIRGKFPMFLAETPLVYGMYNVPASFDNNITAFYGAMKQFTTNGIKLGIHTFMCRVVPSSPLFSANNLKKYYITTLSSGINSAVTAIPVSEDIAINEDFLHYSGAQASYYSQFRFVIDNEIVYCDITATQLVSCTRGNDGTTAASHTGGSNVYYTLSVTGGFYIDHDNKAIMQQSIDGFNEVMEELKISYIYADGSISMYPKEFGGQFGDLYVKNRCMFPYIEKMNYLEYIQYGGGTSSWDYFYCVRGASWDGVVFKNKEFTKTKKLYSVLNENNYGSQGYHEFGWWKIHGSLYDNGKYDYDSTTFDDVHYVMSKVFLTERSIGLQLGSYASSHERYNDVFDIVARYHDLIALDIENEVIERKFKEIYKQPEKEVEITSELNFIEKKVHRIYVKENGHSYSLNNAFYSQGLTIQIRPKFDYYEYSDASHTLISNFASSGSFATDSSTLVTCNVLNNGVISIQNNDMLEIGWCSIDIPSSFNLAHKRGIGLDITGDNSDLLVFVHLDTNSFSGVRDFSVPIDFTGRQVFIMGDPTTANHDTINGTTTSVGGSTRAWRSWNFDWSGVTASILILVPRGGSGNIQLHELKGLQEKSNVVKNPSITVWGCTTTFPVTLHVNDTWNYFFEYSSSTHKYYLYTPNQKLLSEGEFLNDCTYLWYGNNVITFGSDVSDVEYSNRMEVLISVYGSVILPYFNRPNVALILFLVFLVAFLICLPIIIGAIVVIVVVVYFRIQKVKKEKVSGSGSSGIELN